MTISADGDSVDAPGVIEALKTLFGIERRVFRKTVIENASFALGAETSADVVATSGFTSWIHLALARQYGGAGAACLLSGTALGLGLDSWKVHSSALGMLQVLASVVGVLLFIASFFRIYTATVVKRKYIEAGRHQAALGEQRAKPRTVLSFGVTVSIGIVGLDELAMGICFASSSFEVTRLTGYFVIAVSLCWLGAFFVSARKRRPSQVGPARKVIE